MKKNILLLLILGIMIFNSTVFAVNDNQLDEAIEDTAEYIYKEVSSPIIGSVGGEWAILGLGRSDYKVADKYYQDYYNKVVDYVKKCKGVLHKKKYTEYSRLIVALTSIGKDPRDIGGYNLLIPLGDYEKVIWQGINGPIWALIALDSGNYSMSINDDAKVQASREMYVDRILDCQLDDGGFSLFGGSNFESKSDRSDPDITGMALQALAKYQYRDDVKKVTKEALDTLSKLQNSLGGYSSWGSENSESCVQVIVAICELNIPLSDSRFIKNGHTLLENLLTFHISGNGFLHVKSGSGVNMMATEQALYGLVSIKRIQEDKNSLYRMSDAINIKLDDISYRKGLEGKSEKVKFLEYIYPGKTFRDIKNHSGREEIEELAARGIINGKEKNIFNPDETMTRAEFACIIIKALGLEGIENTKFIDVKVGSWYEKYVGAAYYYGFINGRSENIFDPLGIITKEEAASIVAKVAKLVGIDNTFKSSEIKDILAQFTDYVEVSTWARKSMAICYKNDILSQEDLQINPKESIKRFEVAVMLFNLLKVSKLI